MAVSVAAAGGTVEVGDAGRRGRFDTVASKTRIQYHQNITLHILIVQLLFSFTPITPRVLRDAVTQCWIYRRAELEITSSSVFIFFVIHAMSRVIDYQQVVRPVVLGYEGADVVAQLVLRFRLDVELDDAGCVVEA